MEHLPESTNTQRTNVAIHMPREIARLGGCGYDESRGKSVDKNEGHCCGCIVSEFFRKP